MAFPSVETLTTIVDPIAASHHMDVEEIKINRAGSKTVVAVALDSDNRPDLDTLEVVSGEISEAFDGAEESGVIAFGGQGYTLEVSTPGVDHPLTLPRHWRRNRGRLVTWDDGGTKRTGRIGALNDAETEVVLISREGKNMCVDVRKVAEIGQAVVEIEFATVPADEKAVADEDFNIAAERREEHK
jgi:ribosome maturation factor rimP